MIILIGDGLQVAGARRPVRDEFDLGGNACHKRRAKRTPVLRDRFARGRRGKIGRVPTDATNTHATQAPVADNLDWEMRSLA